MRFKFTTINKVEALDTVKAVMRDNSYVTIPKGTVFKLSDLKSISTESEGILYIKEVLTTEQLQHAINDDKWLNAFIYPVFPIRISSDVEYESLHTLYIHNS